MHVKIIISSHVVVVGLDLSESCLAEGVRLRTIENLADPAACLSQDAQLQLLLLLFHLVLRLEQ